MLPSLSQSQFFANVGAYGFFVKSFFERGFDGAPIERTGKRSGHEPSWFMAQFVNDVSCQFEPFESFFCFAPTPDFSNDDEDSGQQ